MSGMMMDLMGYSLASSPPAPFLPGVDGLSEVRRSALRESCRDVLVIAAALAEDGEGEYHEEDPSVSEAADVRVSELIWEAVNASSTLSSTAKKAVARKLDAGQWGDLFLDGTAGSAPLPPLGPEEVVDSLRAAILSILSSSRRLAQLPHSTRRELGMVVLGEGGPGANGQNTRAGLRSRFMECVMAIPNHPSLDAETKRRIVDDATEGDYAAMLLPDRLDCDEGNEGSSMQPRRSSLGLDELDQPRRPCMPGLSDSVQLAEVADVPKWVARQALDESNGDADVAAAALLDFVDNLPSSLEVPSREGLTSLANFASTDFSASCNLADMAGTTRERARSAINRAGGNVDKAADTLLSLMIDEGMAQVDAVEGERPANPTILERAVSAGSFRGPTTRSSLTGSVTEEEVTEAHLCPICFTSLLSADSGKSDLKCGHSFCRPCLRSWAGSHGVPFPCPVCRKKIGLLSYHLPPWLRRTGNTRLSDEHADRR